MGKAAPPSSCVRGVACHSLGPLCSKPLAKPYMFVANIIIADSLQQNGVIANIFLASSLFQAEFCRQVVLSLSLLLLAGAPCGNGPHS